MSGLINIKNDCPPIIRQLNEILGQMREKDPSQFPDFSKADTVISLSDYAGDDQAGNYDCLSFFLVDFNNAGVWEIFRREFRKNEKYFIGEMQFKKINQDKVRQRILSQYLNLFDRINGLSLTFLIHRNVKKLIAESPHVVLEKEGLGKWKPHIAEKLLRAIHFQMPLVYGLTSQKNMFSWLTDRDAITKDQQKLLEIFQRISSIYQTHTFRKFSLAVKFEEKSLGLVIEDLMSIPDLVGGAVLEFHNQIIKEAGIVDNVKVQSKSSEILKWLANKKTNLKKHVCIIELKDKLWNMRFLNYNPKI